MRNTFVTMLLFWSISLCINGQALYSGDAEPYRVEALSMKDCLLRAIKYNLDIEIEGYNPKLRELDIIIASSAFDPALTSAVTYGDTKQKLSTQSSSTSTTQSHFEIGMQKKHHLGGTVSLVYGFDFSDAHGSSFPQWGNGLTLRATQPLLRNLGIETNMTQIRVAQLSLDSSYYGFSQKILNVLTNVETTYWDLVNARENYELQRKSLELAENLYKITMERIKVGSLAAAEILDAERDMAFKQDALVTAERNIYNVEDKLKQLIRPLDIVYYQEVRLIPVERPVFNQQAIVLDEILQYAMAHRFDLQQSKLSMQSIGYQVDYQKNQLLPKLDFTASFGLSGNDTSFGKSLDPVGDFDYPRWQVGLTLEIPFGNRAASSSYQKLLLQREQLLSQHRNLENVVILEVRQATRDLLTSLRRVETARRTRELAEKQLANEENKFRAGLIALFQVQDTEKKLTEARISEVTAFLDYQRALVALDKVKGALDDILRRYDIVIVNPADRHRDTLPAGSK